MKKWLISSILFAELGSSIFSFILSLTILDKTNSALSYSTILIIDSVTSVIVTPFVGSMVDRYSKRKLLAVSQCVSIITLIVFFAFFEWHNKIDIISTAILTAFLSISDIIYGTTLMSSAVYIVDNEESLVTFNSIQESLSSFCSLTGPLIAGALYPFLDLQAFLFFEILCEGIAIFLFLRLPYHERPLGSEDNSQRILENSKSSGTYNSFFAAIKYIFTKKVVLWLILGMFFINFFLASLSVGLPFVIFTKLSGNSLSIGAIEIAMPIGMIIASILLPYLKFMAKELPTIMTSWGICGLLIVLMALTLKFFSTPLMIFVMIILVINFGIGIVLTSGKIPLVTYMQRIVSAQKQGRIFAIFDSLVQIAIPLGTAFYGYLFDSTSSVAIFGVSGTIIVIFVLLISRKVLAEFKLNS
ncbi:major facilitator superfamily transporter [Ligilactobacillus salitolerans]|uniref:Major facilitator superfamily transporter n=1 Tax=Ligilactobacillus salitolerans TaxID=1808352 RepID=A0A401IVL9_9LACO|nr:MFS transporter [Ligilactobacillus salitolerans]GBG95555.1 major facilitator superfamily transporter [Ligilactobacillus salitolerans]